MNKISLINNFININNSERDYSAKFDKIERLLDNHVQELKEKIFEDKKMWVGFCPTCNKKLKIFKEII